MIANVQRHPKPTLVLFCGLPGSGKTTLAKVLARQGKGIRICTDDWQDDLGIPHADEDFHEILQGKLYKFALELLEHGQDVILEDGLRMRNEREEKLADARSLGAYTELHYFDLTFEEIWNRLETRNASQSHGAVHIPKQEIEDNWNKFERPTSKELSEFDSVFVYRDETPLPMAI